MRSPSPSFQQRRTSRPRRIAGKSMSPWSGSFTSTPKCAISRRSALISFATGSVGRRSYDALRRWRSYDRRPTDPVAKEINALLLEIAHFGVDVKDPDQGLIDFPAIRRGREVLLCWKLGEGDRISYWHSLEAGYAGRKLIED